MSLLCLEHTSEDDCHGLGAKAQVQRSGALLPHAKSPRSHQPACVSTVNFQEASQRRRNMVLELLYARVVSHLRCFVIGTEAVRQIRGGENGKTTQVDALLCAVAVSPGSSMYFITTST